MSEAQAIDALAGIWRSEYTYNSSDRDADFTTNMFVRLYPKGNELIIESIPDVNESYLLVRLSADGNVMTGSWQEVTNPKGHYKGAIYHGAMQLIVADDHLTMRGKWVGFGKRMEVKTGPWQFTYLGDDMSVIDDAKADVQ